MELIIDANILMSALIATQGKTFDLIFNDKIKLFAPEFLFKEIEKHKRVILEKSGLEKTEFELFLSIIKSRINIIPKNEFIKYKNQSEDISPDINDSIYFALALKLNCSIWTNDKKLKEQNKIKIINTKKLLNLI